MQNFQQIIRNLSKFWEDQGCCVHQGYDLEAGAGTFNPTTFLRCLGPEPYSAAYVEPCRRPTDGRYGENPNRIQHYFQFQVILKPSPSDIQSNYLKSLEAIGVDLSKHDIRFVHDDWESPTLGAWGLGWETWLDGMEVSQITYFQSVGGVSLHPITGEITYGLERLAMYLQDAPSIFDLKWNEKLSYGDLYHQNEVEWSGYNFEHANVEMWQRHFDDYEKEANNLLSKHLPLPAYDFVAKASHAFNLLDARGVISVTERTGYIRRLRQLAAQIAQSYIKSRENLKHPILKKTATKKKITSAKELSPPTLKTEKEDFLLEIGIEELPASFVPIGMQGLQKQIESFLKEQKVPFHSTKCFGTPRRLAILVKDLATKKKKESIERKGPSISQAFDEKGAPTKAANGFFKSVQITQALSLDEIRKGKITNIEIRELKGQEYLFASYSKPEVSTAKLLQENLPKLIQSIPFPKIMRWAEFEITFARPILWLTVLYGDQVIPIELGGIQSGDFSFGHRQLDPAKFSISHAKNYTETLKNHFVQADVEERKQTIHMALKNLHKDVMIPPALLDEVTQLVEWPKPLLGNFDKEFLEAPKELLISEMIEHQRYFPICKASGELLPHFITVCNVEPSDLIQKGYETVLSARLSDGMFLFKQDLSHSIEDFVEKLKHITYQKELGTIFDKTKRLESHVESLSSFIPKVDLKIAKRAAYLCKADLATASVYEFPDLQGAIGRSLALAKNEDKGVATAIEEHWLPTSEKGPLPQTPEGILLSLSEKLDNIIGCFGIGLIPTSSSDPYALRRQVLGIVKIVIEHQISLPLNETLKNCAKNFQCLSTKQKDEACKLVANFFKNRIKTVFQSYGFLPDEIEASLSTGVSDIFDAFQRVQALHEFRKESIEFPKLYEVFKRAKGQIDAAKTSGKFQQTALIESSEKALFEAVEQIRSPYETAIDQKEYSGAYLEMAKLQKPLNDLFDQVKILHNDPAIRQNRVGLLQQVFLLFKALLDFSKIQKP